MYAIRSRDVVVRSQNCHPLRGGVLNECGMCRCVARARWRRVIVRMVLMLESVRVCGSESLSSSLPLKIFFAMVSPLPVRSHLGS